MSVHAPNLYDVKAAAIDWLTQEATDQVVCITGQGDSAAIAVSVEPGAYALWASLLRHIADQLDVGLPSTEPGGFFDATKTIKPN